MKTKKTTCDAIYNHLDSYFNGDESRRSNIESDVLDLLDDMNVNDASFGDDYLLVFDCLSNVSSQSDGTTIASYQSKILNHTIVVDSMFTFSAERYQDIAEAIIEANDKALELEARISRINSL